MKILWLCSWYPNRLDAFGGDFVERHAKALSAFQSVDVIHVVQNNFLLDNAKHSLEIKNEMNLRVFLKIIPYPNTGIPFLNKIFFNRKYFSQLKQLLDQYIQKNGRPDLVHVHVPVKIGAGALYLKKKYNIPFVVTEHNSAYFSHIPLNYQSNNFYYKYVTRKTFTEAAAVSSVSDWLLSRLTHLFSLKSYKLIRNVVDTSLFYYTRRENMVKRFVHVSMMDSLKNVKGIINAFIQLDKSEYNWELVLIGPPQDTYQKLTEEAGMSGKIIWTGLIPYEEVAKQMKTSDVLVHFSHYENLPCVVSEALCCGLTVISSDVGGIKELINNENGILVEPGNVNALKNALQNYLANVSLYNREMISQKATRAFGYTNIGDELYTWYKQVLNISTNK